MDGVSWAEDHFSGSEKGGSFEGLNLAAGVERKKQLHVDGGCADHSGCSEPGLRL